MSDLRRKLLMGAAQREGEDSIPTEYTQVEYIENRDHAMIDTGLICSMSKKYIIEFQQNDTQGYRIWGASNQRAFQGVNYSLTWGNGFYVRCESRPESERFIMLAATDTKKHIVELSKNGFIIDGINKGLSEGFKEDFDLKYTAYLFTLNPGGTEASTHLHGKIFKYKVYDKNNKLIQYFIPCISPDKEVGMYDLVNRTFYGSANEYKFIAGPVKSKYIQFEDPEVAKICVQNFSSDGIGVTYGDAEKVTELTQNSGFRNNKNVKSFDEIKYFKNLKTIGSLTFQNTSLIRIVLPPLVTTIGSAAFADSGTLKFIDIPKGVNFLGDWMFSKQNLDTMIVRNENQVVACSPSGVLATSSFADGIYVSDMLLEQYKIAGEWKYHASKIKPLSSYVPQ